MISKTDAYRVLNEKLINKQRIAHSLVVSVIMVKLAERIGTDQEIWELTGLLHDLDYDLIEGDMTQHGIIAAELLKCKLPNDCLYAIKAHDHRTGVKPQTILDKALIVSDSSAIFLG